MHQPREELWHAGIPLGGDNVPVLRAMIPAKQNDIPPGVGARNAHRA